MSDVVSRHALRLMGYPGMPWEEGQACLAEQWETVDGFAVLPNMSPNLQLKPRVYEQDLLTRPELLWARYELLLCLI